MNPLYRMWWRFLMDLRPLVRFLAERFPRLAAPSVRLRLLLHWIVGNPIHSLALVDGFMVWHFFDIRLRWIALAIAVFFVLVEIYHRANFAAGTWMIAWREAWRIRRRWPADWAAVAAKTARVQAEVGTSKEPMSSAILRPVADHPKMSWLPRVEWPVVSWWVGPPPGRSLAALDDLAVVLAANISHVSDVSVEYERENDSHGRLVMSFDNLLARPSAPTWVDSAPAIVRNWEPARPGLRLVDDLEDAPDSDDGVVA
ncbi:MAG: hypothetical protein ACRBK7_30375 [Acidimicrobiales bacterium]